MIALTAPPRPRLPTIFSIYQPLGEYWRTYGPLHEFGPEPERVFPPLDAFLIHLILERMADAPVLIDLAVESTGAASSVLGLLHPRVQAVIAGSWSPANSSDRTLAALEDYRLRHCPATNMEIRSAAELLAGPARPRGAVLLMDARTLKPDVLADSVARWRDCHTDVLILLLGLGTVGACSALEAVLRVCPAGGGRRFWLARELDGALSASSLGIFTPESHPDAAEILFRLQQMFTTNHDFLQLLRDANQRALEAAQLDGEVMKSHPSAWALHNELEEWKRHTNTAREQAEQTRHQLVQAQQTATAIAQHRDALQQRLDAVEQSLAHRLALRVRRFRLYRMLRGLAQKCWRSGT